MTNPVSARAARIRLAWPACKAPMVGTRPIVNACERAFRTAVRTSAMAPTTWVVATVPSKASTLLLSSLPRQEHFQIGAALGVFKAQFFGRLRQHGTGFFQLIFFRLDFQLGKGAHTGDLVE